MRTMGVISYPWRSALTNCLKAIPVQLNRPARLILLGTLQNIITLITKRHDSLSMNHAHATTSFRLLLLKG